MKCMMGYIKSRFSGNTVFWGVLMVISLFSFIIFTFKALKNYSLKISDTLILLFFIFLFFFLINYLKNIKHIIIKENTLKYYSIIQPFGKTLDLNNYIGKIVLQETGSAGSYKVVYLINKQNETSFKMMGLHYKNFDDINDAIQLKIIKFSPTTSQYFKLLFFERLKITNNKGNGETISVILRIFKVICIVGIILFILSLILKRFL